MARKTRYIRKDFKTRDEWLMSRNSGIGASEAAAAIGLSDYLTPYKLWRRKLLLDAPMAENASMIQGHVQEPHIASMFEKEEGKKIIASSKGDWLAIDPEYSFLRVSPDWLYWSDSDSPRNESNKSILECKSSLNNDRTPECIKSECISWFVQIQYQMHVMGYRDGYIGFVHIPTNNHWFAHVDYNEKFCLNTIIKPLVDIWHRHYEPAVKYLKEIGKDLQFGIDGSIVLSPEQLESIHRFAPPSFDGEDVVKRYPKQTDGFSVNATKMFINPSEVSRLGIEPSMNSVDRLIDRYKKNSSKVKELNEENKKISDIIKLQMCDAESIEIDGKTVATFRANKESMVFDEELFKSEHESLFNTYMKRKEGSRVLRIK